MPESTSFDPVEVSTLAPDAVARNVTAALAGHCAPASDLDALKAARLAHDRRPVPACARESGDRRAPAGCPQSRAGKRVGAARGEVQAALEARAIELAAERDARVLIDEAVDVTLPSDRRVDGARHPLTTIQELFADIFVAMGYEVAEGPEIEAEWFNFDALNIPPDHPARTLMDTFFVGSEDSRAGAAHPYLARAGSDDAHPNAADLRRVPRQGVPHRRARRHPHPGVPPDRGPRRRRRHHHGPPEGHARPHGPGDVRAGDRDPAAAVLLPVHRAVRRAGPAVLRVPGPVGRQPGLGLPHLRQRGLDRVGRLRHGQSPACCAHAGSTPSGTADSPSAWASSEP